MKHHHHPGDLVPPGLLAARSWLLSKRVERHTVDNWLKSGQLVAVARGVFKRPEADLTWQGVVCSLQRMGLNSTPGGLTSLALQGMTHHLSLGEPGKIHLYGHQQLPEWVNTLLPETTFHRHQPLELDSSADDSGFHMVPWKTQVLSFGYDRCQLQISSPELAMLELLMDVPKSVSFEHASNLLQGLPTLSPQKVVQLLEHCRNVKVKRLFLWLAEKNQSPWLKKLDLQKFSIEGGTLGSGKRVVAKGGKLDSKYLITVPPEMVGENHG
jgi:hypothetical protein